MQEIRHQFVQRWAKLEGHRHPTVIRGRCPHCGERVLFQLNSHRTDAARLTVASTALCAGCTKQVRFWTVRDDDRGPEPGKVFAYPSVDQAHAPPALTSDVPAPLERSLIATIDAFNQGNYNATAVCARRTLEGIFKYRVADEHRGETLYQLIDRVCADADLAAPLSALSHAIRGGGNLGAHFDEEREPTKELARAMVELLTYLISYLYVLPQRIVELEERLGAP